MKQAILRAANEIATCRCRSHNSQAAGFVLSEDCGDGGLRDAVHASLITCTNP